MKSNAVRLMLLSAMMASGCAGMQPRSGVAPSGEPLSIQSSSSTRTETVTEKVGETDHYTADGEYVGTSEQYADRSVTHSSFHWWPQQGDAVISDEDAFRIAGDHARADQARRYRRTGVAMTVGGSVLMAAGVGMALSVPLTGGFEGSQSLGLYAGGGLVAAAGGLSFALGFKRIKRDGHPHPSGDMQGTMDEYNRSLGSRPTARVAPAGRSVMVPLLSGRF
ncbi:MAG: hypothetical protein KDK70_34805 [Myxococcales bacterium]|nr:hypothetical protein [Myxococcales bacterium]